jgi:HNH endonuclease
VAISKRLRFEVFRRDGFACRYCGAKAPDVRLVPDHVVPEALGGKTEPSNLVTSCDPCNSGKTSTTPDAPLVAQVTNDALRWSRAVAAAAEAMLADQEARDGNAVTFERRWNESRVGSKWSLPDGWRASVDRFLAAGLPLPVLLSCLDKATGNKNITYDSVFRYMCGIAWRKVGELQEAAGAALGQPPARSRADGACGPECDWTCPGRHDDPRWAVREELALQLCDIGRECFPELHAEAMATAQEDLEHGVQAAVLHGERKLAVLAAFHLMWALVGQLSTYELVVKTRMGTLEAAELDWCCDQVEGDYAKAGEGPSTNHDHLRHLLRYMLHLQDRVEA